MTRPAIRGITLVLMLAVTGVSACSSWRSSSVNPSNWFGRSRVADVNPAEIGGTVNPLLPESADEFLQKAEVAVEGETIDQVSSLIIEPTIEGAIIRAEGLALREGAFDARLIPQTLDETPIDGVLTYRFMVKYPNQNTYTGTQATRTVNVARTITAGHLEGVQVIRVLGTQNAQESRRR